MSRVSYKLTTQHARDRVKFLADNADAETVVEFREDTRSLAANRRMWAMLGKISSQLTWHGAKWPAEDWKAYFSHSLRGGRFMPHENGGYIPVGYGTSKMTKEEHGDLTLLIEAFADRHGVELGDG